MTISLSIYQNSRGQVAFSFDDEILYLPSGASRSLDSLRPGAWEFIDEGEGQEIAEYLEDEQREALQGLLRSMIDREAAQEALRAHQAAAAKRREAARKKRDALNRQREAAALDRMIDSFEILLDILERL